MTKHEDAGADMARRAMERLRFPGGLVYRVEKLVRDHMWHDHASPSPAKARRFRARYGDELIPDMLALKRADIGGKQRDVSAMLAEVDEWEALLRQERDAPVYLSDLEITGGDLLEVGFEGPAIGEALNALLREVIGNPEVNNRDWLLRMAAKMRRKQ
jgi:hypothetical protein